MIAGLDLLPSPIGLCFNAVAAQVELLRQVSGHFAWPEPGRTLGDNLKAALSVHGTMVGEQNFGGFVCAVINVLLLWSNLGSPACTPPA